MHSLPGESFFCAGSRKGYQRKVKVSFMIPDVPDSADNANIYHHTDEDAEAVLKEKIEVHETETETCGTEEYAEEEDESPVILMAEGCVSVYQEDGIWMIAAEQELTQKNSEYL